MVRKLRMQFVVTDAEFDKAPIKSTHIIKQSNKNTKIALFVL